MFSTSWLFLFLGDPCAQNPCLNGGQCVPNNMGGFTCVCVPPYSGPRCEDCEWSRLRLQYICMTSSLLANPCANSPCGPNGQCIQNNGGYYCECNLGYYGNRCEREFHSFIVADRVWFDPNKVVFAYPILAPMVAHANLVQTAFFNASVHQNMKDNVVNFVSLFHWIRKIIFLRLILSSIQSGKVCQPNPCQNGGTCSPYGLDTYSCNCPFGFTGRNCETRKTFTPRRTFCALVKFS